MRNNLIGGTGKLPEDSGVLFLRQKDKALGFSQGFFYGETMNITTHPTPILPKVWQQLSKAMSEEMGILGTRTSPDNLANVYSLGFANLILLDGNAIGFIATWPVGGKFVEIGSAWVHPAFRGNGYGSQLYASIGELPGIKDVLAFAITSNPIAIKAGERAGLRFHQDWKSPVPWRLTCGPCTWVDEHEKVSCKKRGITCWLRLRH